VLAERQEYGSGFRMGLTKVELASRDAANSLDG
jgi:hypothetical protein